MTSQPEYITLHDKRFKLFIESNRIQEIAKEVAGRISNDFAGKIPVLIITLKGATNFAVDMMKYLTIDCTIETVRAKSYGSGMVSQGSVLVSQLTGDIKDKDVVIIEDIVDTGLTAKSLIEEFSKLGPKSIKIASFLIKPEMLKTDVVIDYVGFEIPPAFVVGYGLDYAELGRNYPSVYSLAE